MTIRFRKFDRIVLTIQACLKSVSACRAAIATLVIYCYYTRKRTWRDCIIVIKTLLCAFGKLRGQDFAENTKNASKVSQITQKPRSRSTDAHVF
jgi:hypothetical protein